MPEAELRIVMVGESLERQGGIVSVEKLILQQAPPQVHVRLVATLVKGSAIARAFGFVFGLANFLRMLMFTRCDLVHVHVSEAGSAFRKSMVALIASWLRKPVIMHTHGPEFPIFFAKLPRLVQGWFRWTFGKCARFIVLSDSWKAYYTDALRLRPERVVVLLNAVKLPHQLPDRSKSPHITLAFLGRIGQRKGAFDAIEAYAKLPEACQHRSRMIMAGDGEVEKAREQIERHRMTDRVTVLSWLTAEQRDELLGKANIFVLPSYNEGLPMSLLEAMSWGVPPIVTPVGGIPEVIRHGENGLLIEPGNVDQLCDAMRLLIEDESQRAMLGSGARKSMLPHDANLFMSHLLDMYLSVLHRSTSAAVAEWGILEE